LSTYSKVIIKIWQFEKKIPSKSGEFGAFLFIKNPLYWSKSYFSGRHLAKFLTKKKKHKVKAACADHHCSLNSYGWCGEALGERKVKGDGSAVSAQPTTPLPLLSLPLSLSPFSQAFTVSLTEARSEL
jgi:hypothetical protein